MAEEYVQITELPVAPLPLADSDIALIVRGATTYQTTVGAILASARRTNETLLAEIVIDEVRDTGAEPIRLINNNLLVGTIVGVDLQLGTGDATAAFSIADQDGSNVAAITGLTGLVVGASLTQPNASGANTMNKTGTSRRKLLLDLTGVSAAAGPLVVGVRYTLA